MSGAAEDTWEDKTKYLSSATTFWFNKIILAQWHYTFELKEIAKGLIFFKNNIMVHWGDNFNFI